jgi:CheY-like chemotaxis protein
MEAIGQLTGGVAHDFNNLLQVILGNLDRLRRRHKPGDDSKQAEAEFQRMTGAAIQGAQRAAQLTQRMLAFSRRQPLAPKPVDVNKLVSGMSEMLGRTLGETIQLEPVLSGGLWRTLADENQLENALLNLAVNARDAMPNGGKLTIEAANVALDEAYSAAEQDNVRPGQYVMIAVSDTGAGMPPDVLTKAFEPFFTTKDVGQGTGLGLSQVYGFIKQSGGHVKIYSEQGEGTTVKLYLPRLATADTQIDAIADTWRVQGSSYNETVLVVEDERDVRRLAVEALEELGYRVLEAEDGHVALKLLEREPGVRLLFTDVGLPGGLNGRQLADQARQRWPSLKVLFTTGYARNAIVHHGRLDPGVELIGKPFQIGSLAAKVRELLDTPS